MVLDIDGTFFTADELDDAILDGALTEEEVLDAVTHEIYLLQDCKRDIEVEIAHLEAQHEQLRQERGEAIAYYRRLTGDTESMW